MLSSLVARAFIFLEVNVQQILQRAQAVHPSIWVMMVLAAVLGYGAKAIAHKAAGGDEKKETDLAMLFKLIAIVLCMAAVIVSVITLK